MKIISRNYIVVNLISWLTQHLVPCPLDHYLELRGVVSGMLPVNYFAEYEVTECVVLMSWSVKWSKTVSWTYTWCTEILGPYFWLMNWSQRRKRRITKSRHKLCWQTSHILLPASYRSIYNEHNTRKARTRKASVYIISKCWRCDAIWRLTTKSVGNLYNTLYSDYVWNYDEIPNKVI